MHRISSSVWGCGGGNASATNSPSPAVWDALSSGVWTIDDAWTRCVAERKREAPNRVEKRKQWQLMYEGIEAATRMRQGLTSCEAVNERNNAAKRIHFIVAFVILCPSLALAPVGGYYFDDEK
ncbi:hypothetical protein ACHAWF_000854 [Thalassiosira exigua]